MKTAGGSSFVAVLRRAVRGTSNWAGTQREAVTVGGRRYFSVNCLRGLHVNTNPFRGRRHHWSSNRDFVTVYFTKKRR
jgi:hypothetical protein